MKKVKCEDCQLVEIVTGSQKRRFGIKLSTHYWCPKRKEWIRSGKFTKPRKCRYHTPVLKEGAGKATEPELRFGPG